MGTIIRPVLALIVAASLAAPELIGDAPQMIDRLVAEFSASGTYQCRREQPEP